jgi:hypothetical protein
MEAMAVPSLREALRVVPDPRKARGKRYSAASLLTRAVCAMLSGARSLYAIAPWGWEHHTDPLRAALGIGHADMPSVAPLFGLFRDRDRDAFAAALAAWLAAQPGAPVTTIALDGKTLRGIHGEEVPGVHLVAAFAHGRGEVLGQRGQRPRRRTDTGPRPGAHPGPARVSPHR